MPQCLEHNRCSVIITLLAEFYMYLFTILKRKKSNSCDYFSFYINKITLKDYLSGPMSYSGASLVIELTVS